MDWLGLLGTFLGAGGIGYLIVSGIINRRKNNADATKVESDAKAVDQGVMDHAYESLANTAKLLSDTTQTLVGLYENRVKSLCERVEALEKKSDAKDGLIDTQQKEIVELRSMVDKLTTENAKLRAENINLTRRLRDVESKLRGLTGLVDHDGSES